MEQFRVAVALNTILWGGIYNPIIPIKSSKDTILSEYLIKLFDVDALYAIGAKTSYVAETLDRHPSLVPLWRKLSSPTKVGAQMNFLDIQHLSEGKRRFPDLLERAAIFEWEDDEPLSDMFLTVFGHFDFGPELKWSLDYKNLVSSTLGVSSRSIEKTKEVVTMSDDNLPTYSPILQTSLLLQSDNFTISAAHHGFYVGDPRSAEDLINFWNIRALGATFVQFFPIGPEGGRMKKSAAGYAAWLRSRGLDEVYIYRNEANDEDVSGLMAEVSKAGIKTRMWLNIEPHIWNGLNWKPVSFYISERESSLFVDSNNGSYSTLVQLPERVFLKNKELEHQQHTVAFNFKSSAIKLNAAAPLPRLEALNEFYGRNIFYDGFGTKVDSAKGDLSKVVECRSSSLHMGFISRQKFIEEVFATCGIRSSLSTPGVTTRQLFQKMDSNIWNCDVFQIKGLRELLLSTSSKAPEKINIEELSSPEEAGDPLELQQERQTKTLKPFLRNVAVRQIGQDFVRYEKMRISLRRSGDKLSADDVFQFMVEKDFIRTGLSVSCGDCHAINWLPLGGIRELWECIYCGYSNKMTAHVLETYKKEVWQFMRNGIFAKKGADGAIPVLLTVSVLAQLGYDLMDMGTEWNPFFSTALELSFDGKQCEIDFAFMARNRTDHRLAVAIGECKGGKSINQKDCDNLYEVAQKLETGGEISCYMCFSKLTSFTADEIDLFKNLEQKKGAKIILLAEDELDCLERYCLFEGEYPNSLEDVSRISRQKYLRPNP